ncbi:MAG: TetR family transcriptional regulator [Clostridia bacterium]|nr:TetR family transcriptional regulator [Clostridia bacterium]
MKKSDITKQKILQAAEQAFAEKGLYGARVDGISELAGVNKRMIYAYFGNKKELYMAVLDMVYGRIAEREQAVLSQDADCVELIKKYIDSSFFYLYENQTFVKIVLWENLNEAKYLKESVGKQTKTASFDVLRSVMRKGVEQGVFRDDIDEDELIISTQMMSYSYFSNIYTMTYMMDKDFFCEDEMKKRCAHITDMILRYIMK